MRCKMAIGIFNSFVGQDPSQNIGTVIRLSFPTSETERISLSFFVKEQNNMDPLDRAGTDSLPLAINLSDSAVLPF